MTDRTAEIIRQDQMPKTLNGYAVKAFTISRDGSRALVLVHRADRSLHPWVSAQWWPELGDAWMWGNYHSSYAEADAYRANWISTHGYTEAQTRITLKGRIGGFQE